jgi:hypothetical protein
MGPSAFPAMLATLSGSLALVVGLVVLVLPLLATELSRPRDSAWGAVVLLLGLVLVTSAERFTGSPMLAVLCGGLLIGRLGSEVLQLRWRQLTPEEQQRLLSLERWQTSLSQLAATSGTLMAAITDTGSRLAAALKRPAPAPGTPSKRWVRAETATAEPAPPQEPTPPAAPADTVVVSSFAEIDALIEAEAPEAEAAAPEAAEPEASSSQAG